MDVITSILISYGYWGMLITAFIAGSFFPFSSEAVMMGLMAAGLDPWGLIVYGTIGNVLGSMFNFFVGRMGRIEWISRDTCTSARRNSTRQSSLWVDMVPGWDSSPSYPVLGSAITIALGLMRANILISIISISHGKFLRYVILIYGANLLIG